MNRTCPHCQKKGVPILLVMLWDARCKYCGSKVGVNQAATWLINMLAGVALAAGAYFTYEQFGFIVVLVALGGYILSLFLAELFGPLVVRKRGEG